MPHTLPSSRVSTLVFRNISSSSSTSSFSRCLNHHESNHSSFSPYSRGNNTSRVFRRAWMSTASSPPALNSSSAAFSWTSLTPSQQVVVEHGLSTSTEATNASSPDRCNSMLVTGAPGTGKTHCLTHRIARLLHAGIPASRILALAPSDPAAAVLRHRIDHVVPFKYNDVHVSSFRELCVSILRDFAVELGASDIHIAGEVEAEMFLRKTLFSLPLDRYRPGSNPNRILHALATCFATLHRCGITPSRMSSHAAALRSRLEYQQKNSNKNRSESPFQNSHLTEDYVLQQEEIARVFSRYHEFKQDRNMLESAEVPSLLIERLRSRPHAAGEVRSMFEHVMVEHLEDLFPVHSSILPFLGSQSMTAFGDDDTAMMEFMEGVSGTRPFAAFASTFPSASVHTLTTSFRTDSPQILHALRRLISFNPKRIETEFGISKKYTNNTESPSVEDQEEDVTVTGEMKDVEYSCHRSDTGEVESVASRIRDMLNTSYLAPSIAVLTRYSADATRIGGRLRQEGLDVWIAGARQLMERQEIKALLSLLTIAMQPNNSQAAHDLLVSFPFSLPKLMVAKLTGKPSIADNLERLSNDGSVSSQMQIKAADAASTLRRLWQQANTHPAVDILTRFLTRPSLHSIYTDPQTQEHANAALNISKFLSLVESAQRVLKRNTVHDVVPYLNMLRQRGVEEATDDAPESAAVHVMSMHKAKGREYDYVFIVGANDSNIPGTRRRKDIPVDPELTGLAPSSRETHVQAERRIMYTSMSRARKGVIISSVISRDNFQLSSKEFKPSRFVAESLALPKKSILYSIPLQSCDESVSHSSSSVKTQEASSVFGSEGMEPTEKELNQISNLTYEHIQEYTTCPLRFKYLFVHHLPRTFSWSTNYDKAITSAIEKCDQYFKQYDILPSMDIAETYLHESWVSWGFLSKEHEAERLSHAKRVLAQFILRDNKRKTCQGRHVPFIADLAGTSVSGYWNRIYEGQSGIEIIHLKPNISKTRLKSKPEDNFVLLLNALAYEKLTGVSVSTSCLESIETGETIKYTPKSQDMVKTEKTIHNIQQNIKSGKFKPKPTKWNCRHCDFKTVCPSATT